MSSVLGLPLEKAVDWLKAEGTAVELVEARCRKGSEGNERRIIKQEETEAGTILTWSLFRTTTER